MVKSGTDFREFSFIEMNGPGPRVNKILKYHVNSSIEEKPEIKQIVDSYLENINKEMDKLLGIINADLEGRFAYVRKKKFNLILQTVLVIDVGIISTFKMKINF